MFDGSLKAAEDAEVGDLLMGPDSAPRTVLDLCRGEDEMYEVQPTKGEPFFVNGEHVLTLVRTNEGKGSKRDGRLVDVTVRDWLGWPKWKKHVHKLFRAGVDFENRYDGTIDPYFLGLLLGGGSTQHTPALHNVSKTLIEVAQAEADRRGLRLVARERRPGSLFHFFASDSGAGENVLKTELSELGLLGKSCGKKFIPECVKTADRETRLQVLAGLVDTDGSLAGHCYDFNLKSKRLAEDVAFVARSLGLAADVEESRKQARTGPKRQYHRVTVCGDVNQIPSRIKAAAPRRRKKDVLRTGFKVRKVADSEAYYGFTLDGDRRYLLDDFTVTHNSGKTLCFISLMKCLHPGTPTLFLTSRSSLVDQNYQDMQEWGVPHLGRWYGGYKEFGRVMCCTSHVSTLKSLKKLFPLFKVVIVDEVHDTVSKVPVEIYERCKGATVRVGFSATPFKFTRRVDGKEDCKDKVHKYEVKSQFGPVFKTTTTDTGRLTTKNLQERGILSKSNCTFYPVREPEDIEHEPYIDAVTLGIAENFAFLDHVRRLTAKLAGRTLVLVERIDQGEALNRMIPGSVWISGKNDLESRAKVFTDLKFSGEKVVAIAMRQIVTAGINVYIHNLVNASGGKADHSIVQQLGRGLRCAGDKDGLQYYDFWFETNEYLRKHSAIRADVIRGEGHHVTFKDEIDF